MLQSTLDIVRQHVGEADGPEAIAALQGASDQAVDALVERLLTSPPAPTRAVPPDEVWPLVNARASLLSRGAQGFVDGVGPAGLSVLAAMNPREVGSNTFSNSVIRALLYSHGLVIEDPVALAAEMHATSPAHTRRLSRQFVEAAVVSLFEVDALIDAGVVETFFVAMDDRADESPTDAEMADALRHSDKDELWDAFEAGYIEGLNPALRSLWKKIRAGDRSPPLDLVEEALSETDVEVVKVFIDVVSSLRPGAVIDNTMSIVASALDDQRRFGRRHDILCASELFGRLLFIGSPDPAVELRVRQLARTPVPNIEELDVRDVVAIRQGSDAFATWRARLSLGLERAHRLRDELGAGVDLADAIDEVMADAREQLLDEAKRSRVFGNAGLVSFVAGALGGAVAGAAGGLPAAATGAAGAVASEVIRGGLRPDTHGDALRRHYVLFRPPDALT
ncbi:MAG TPA: hypothetical protein VF529_03310 [Solirubrobacteraceae bacterium]|jgi:hypothetical protein